MCRDTHIHVGECIHKPRLVWDFCLCRVFLSGSYKPIIPRQKLLLRETTGIWVQEWSGGRGHSHPFALTSRLYLLHSILRIIARYRTIAAIVVRAIDWRVQKVKRCSEWKIRYFLRANICECRRYLYATLWLYANFWNIFAIGFSTKGIQILTKF